MCFVTSQRANCTMVCFRTPFLKSRASQVKEFCFSHSPFWAVHRQVRDIVVKKANFARHETFGMTGGATKMTEDGAKAQDESNVGARRSPSLLPPSWPWRRPAAWRPPATFWSCPGPPRPQRPTSWHSPGPRWPEPEPGPDAPSRLKEWGGGGTQG